MDNPIQPEIIDICQEKLEEKCGVSQCALLFTINGLTDGLDSTFRVKAFNGTNKLEAFAPIQDTIEYSGSYKYYWFLSTRAAETNNTEYW